MQRLTALVSGRVQAVGFRFWVQYQTAELGLPGSATNLSDGRVEVVVEGERADCEELLRRLTSGSTPGRVDDVDAEWGPALGLSGFHIG